MEESNSPEKKPKRKGLYILLIIVVALIVFIFLQEKIPHRYMLGAGVNPKTLVFYEKFGIKTPIYIDHLFFF